MTQPVPGVALVGQDIGAAMEVLFIVPMERVLSVLIASAIFLLLILPRIVVILKPGYAPQTIQSVLEI